MHADRCRDPRVRPSPKQPVAAHLSNTTTGLGWFLSQKDKRLLGKSDEDSIIACVMPSMFAESLQLIMKCFQVNAQALLAA